MLKQKLNSNYKVFFAFSKENHVQHQLYYLQQKITFEDSLLCNVANIGCNICNLFFNAANSGCDIYKNIADCGTFQLIFRGKTFMILLNKWETDQSRLKPHKLSRPFP
jgi:hypothetical protein